METWTVVYKTPDGVESQTVEADFADETEDGERLEFGNVGALREVLEAVLGLQEQKPRTEAEAMDVLMGAIRSMGQVKVASFEASSVICYFRGLKATGELSFRLDDSEK